MSLVHMLVRGGVIGLAGAYLATVAPADDGGPALQPSSFDYPAPEPGTYRLPPIERAADGKVLDAQGREVSLRAQSDGRITLLSFFYGNCDDEQGCPLAIATLMGVYQSAQEDAGLRDNLKIVSQSFDPVRDTPDVMAKLRKELLGGGHAEHLGKASRSGSGAGVPWDFLTATDEASIRPLLSAYGQSVLRHDDKDAEKIAHLLRVFLIDREGMIRNIYGVAYMNPDVLLADVKTLLLEEKLAAGKSN